jgi:2-succinyl-6-hydroxy-2,4-cyclohexadiene-1-carboxylate synthase
MTAAYGPRQPALYAERVASPQLSSIRTDSPAGGAPIALLHGFTQTAACWGSFADELSATHSMVAIDLPGHGGSGEVRADLDQTAELVASSIDRSIVIGYSLGGRVALHLALRHPQLVERLVVIGATGGLDSEEERKLRRVADESLADHLEDIGVDAFLDEWLSQPLFASLTAEQSFRELRATNSAAGLASSLRLCGTGTQESLWSHLGELTMPVLVIAGAKDEKFTHLGHRLVESIGTNASIQLIENAGHSAQLENPAATAAVIAEWLSEAP